MTDEELLRSAGLYGTDVATGESGYNLAAILLLGKDEVIQNVCPAYETDALVRKVNVDRYDDREIVNNTLMHREYTSSYAAKLVIKKKQMYTENANRAAGSGFITPENLEPNPKNPLIASFFRNIGRADRLGSGVHKLFKYTKFYSGKDPVFEEGDVFRIVVPLDDDYSFDMGIGSETNRETNTETKETNRETNRGDFLEINMAKTLAIITEEPSITQSELKDKLQISLMSVKRLMKALQDNGIIERIGSNRKGYWKITKKEGHSST